MATEIKLRRGTTAEHSSFNGAEGEVTFDTDLHTLIVHNNAGDGTGERLAKYTEVQASNELSEMLDVNLTSPASGSILRYHSSSDKWIDSDKLAETVEGIDVVGGITANYLDLTGGETIITRPPPRDGLVAARKIVLNDPTGDDLAGTDACTIYTEEGFPNQSKLVIHCADDGNDQVVLRTDNDVDTLIADSNGIDVTGTVTADGVKLGDNDKLQFGDVTTPDLEIYHDGSNSRITDQGTGSLIITGEELSLQAANGYRRVHAENGASGKTLLYYGTDSVSKLATTSTGINVTGTINADGIWLENNQKINLGAESGGKLEIYEATGGNGVIEQTGSGDIIVKGANGSLRNDSNDAVIAWFPTYAALAYRGTSGAGTKLQTTSTGIDVTGTVDCDGLKMDDGEYAQFGTANDLQIFHSGNHSYIKDQGTGILSIETNGDSITFHDSANAKNMAKFSVGGTASLSWAGTDEAGVKLSTTEDGINVTGTVTAGGVSLGDNEKIQLGASQDLELFHDGTNSYVQDAGDGGLILNTTSGNGVFIHSATETMGAFHTDGAVNLYHDNAEKFATTATGINVTGTVTADGVKLGDNEKLQFGDVTTPDLEIYHNGSHSIIEDLGTGNLVIRGASIELKNASNKSKIFITNGADGSVRISHGDDEAATLETTSTGIDVTGTVEADSLTTGDTTINGSFTVNNILFTNTDLNATEFEATQGKRIVRQSGTDNKTFALFQPAASNVGQTWTILNSSSGTITLDADSQYFHILDGVTTSGKQADWVIKRGGVVDIICVGFLDNGGSQSFPNFVIYGSGIIEI